MEIKKVNEKLSMGIKEVSKENKEMARKCDLCEDVKGGPACVRACPTGAIIRIGPEGLMNKIREAV